MTEAQKRIQQINDELKELGDLSLTPQINKAQRNKISSDMRKLMTERDNLSENRNHWLAETQPSLGPVIKAVQRELGERRTFRS